MPSERMQRQIDVLLDEAEAAVRVLDWATVRARCDAILRLDPGNGDAVAMRDAAGRDDPPGVHLMGQADPKPAALPWSLAAGRYAVRRFLGEGARKRVYLAHDERLDRDVAVALIKTEGIDAQGLARVQREAQAMGRLGDHPHIVTIHDVGEDAGQPYIVSQYMAGGAASDLETPLPTARVLDIAKGVCEGLAHAHGQGVVHRDLKPGNVWLAADGTAKIGDFGLAVALDQSRLTMAGMLVGTVAYMAPEQALGGEVTPRADLYALGCLLYEVVTGRPPFLGDDPTAVISQHLSQPPVAPSWLTEHCPPDLEELVLRLLAKDPGQRPGSAAEVLAALGRIDPEQHSASHSESNVLERLARGVFVGREKELERLRKAFDEALAGRGSLAMLVGEPGIGKTRVAQELETYARMRGGQVLWGRAYEGAGAPAYWPWMQVGNQYASANDLAQLQPDMQGKGPALAVLFPWLREQANFVEPEPLLDPESAQFRLFDAYATFVRAMANRAPLVLALDDLHWADKPSLLLLQHVARELGRMRVLVVCTYRDTDLSRTHPLSEALATLNREAGFQRVVLRGLSRDEVAGYIRAAASVTPRPELLDRIYEETEGNPFFLSEVVNLLTQEGKLTESVSDIAVPDGVREALGRRLDRISEEANELLQVAAVAGREFPYETLALLSEHGEDALLHLIEEALEARVIEEMAGAGRYRFTHALMQETLLGELSTTRRVRIHARVGEALERRWGQRADERAARLAVHFVEAAMLSPEHARKAVHYAKLAAEQAEAQSAWDDAARHYEHCLTLVTEAEDALGEDEAALLTSLGVCQRNDAQMRAAWRALMRAIAVSKARDDPMGVARATLGAVGIPAPPGRIDQLLGEAMDLLGDTDPYLQARLILGRTLFSAALESAQLRRVEQILEKHESPDIRAALSFERGMLALTDLRFDDVWPEFDRAYDGLKKHGRVHEVGFILFIRGILPLMLGDLVLGKAAAEDSLRHAREVHSVLWEVNILLRLAGLALALGRREDFDTLMDQVVPNYGRDLLLVAQAELTGDLHRAQSLLPQIDATGGVPSWVAHVHAARARLRLHAGDNDTAIAEISAFKAALGTVQRHRFSTVRYFPILEADDALVLLGESDAQSIYEELCDCAPLRWDPLTLPGADRMRGALALRLGLVDEAVAHLHDGLGWSEREGLWLEAGRCLQGLAEVAARGNDRREALRLLDRAAALFRAYGAKLYLDQVIAKKLDLQGLTGSSIYASIDAIADSVQQERPDVSLHAAPDGTVTIMFGDIEGSTPLNQRLGDARYTALLGEYAALVRSAVEGRSGRVVKHIGDGFMAVFPQPHDALRCAVALQASVAAHGFAEPVRVRCGVHAGSPVREGADFFGVDVTLASRITARALGGEVVVSSAVRDRVGGSGEFAFDAGQDVSLKGLTGVHRLFRAATPH